MKLDQSVSADSARGDLQELRAGRFAVTPAANSYDNPLAAGRSGPEMDRLPGDYPRRQSLQPRRESILDRLSGENLRRQSIVPRRESILSNFGIRRFSKDLNLQAQRASISPELFPDMFDDGTYMPHYTQDLSPRMENYRNLFTISKHMVRPTIDELHQPHGPQVDRRFSDAEGGEKKEMAVKFGWIRGVYMRCLLNIWGVMLFLRMGWMTGQAGIGLAIVIVLLASVVTVLTTMSMSAICTNGEVRGGGAYYMISRSLGPEFGGAIGIIFSFANAVAVSMYIVGAAETVRDLLRTFENGIVEIPSGTNDVRISGICFLVAMTAITGVGMAFENKAQIVLLILLLVALMDYFVGSCLEPTPEQMAKGYVNWNVEVAKDNLGPDFRGESFFSVFSVFFPSVTGILAGANISGDLRDACTAIPKGTLLAIVTTSGSYIVIIIWLGFTLLRDATGNVADLEDGSFANCTGRVCLHGMLNYNQVMEMSAGFGPLIYVGIFAATLSSALAALISAPRIFQALCKDKIFPVLYFFAKGYGPNNDPRRASVLVFIIALLCTIIAELNVIAPIISNFFMASYCLINYSCFHASYVKSPGWRPGFIYYNKWLSLIGAVLCITVMFIMNWITALITFGIVLCLYIYINKNKPDVNWGSSTQAFSYKNALMAVTKLNRTEEHVKNYRPAILVLTGNPCSRPPLVDFADILTRNTGLLVCGHVIKGPLSVDLRSSMVDHNYKWLDERNVKAFYSLLEADSLSAGVYNMLQLVGLGKLKPNIILMGYKRRWHELDKEDFLEYFNVIHHAIDMHLSYGILRLEEGLDYASYFESDLGIPYKDTAEDELGQLSGTDGVILGPIANMKREEPSCGMSVISEENHNGDDGDSDADEQDEEGHEPAPPQLQRFRRLMSMEASRLHPREIPDEVLAAINQFQMKQGARTIDVWWLYDDGGLTLLIPYLLTTKPQWSKCKLRIFSLSHGDGDLDSAQINMAALLKKFRIEYSAVTVLTDANVPPKEQSKKHFKNLISKWMVSNESNKSPLDVTPTDLKMHKEKEKLCIVTGCDLNIKGACFVKTNRHLRLRELVVQHSRDAALIVMTIPLPRKESCPPPLYMSWLEILTKDMPPFLLIRGNQTSVLTFYS